MSDEPKTTELKAGMYVGGCVLADALRPRVMEKPPRWPMIEGKYYVYLVIHGPNGAVIGLDRSLPYLQAAWDRVEVLQQRGELAFFTDRPVQGALL